VNSVMTWKRGAFYAFSWLSATRSAPDWQGRSKADTIPPLSRP
jgi:hypothetical protein